MKKYRVIFEFRTGGVWSGDYFSNNGEGFTYNEALYIAHSIANGLDGMAVRDIKIVEMV